MLGGAWGDPRDIPGDRGWLSTLVPSQGDPPLENLALVLPVDTGFLQNAN